MPDHKLDVEPPAQLPNAGYLSISQPPDHKDQDNLPVVPIRHDSPPIALNLNRARHVLQDLRSCPPFQDRHLNESDGDRVVRIIGHTLLHLVNLIEVKVHQL